MKIKKLKNTNQINKINIYNLDIMSLSQEYYFITFP